MRFYRWINCFIVAFALILTAPAAFAQVVETAPQGSLHVDGKDDLATTGLRIDQSTSGKPVTMEAWVYPTATPSTRHHVITTDNTGYDWSILTEGDKWHVYTNRASKPTGFKVDLNRWQHVAAVFADDGVVFYKDGRPSERFPIGYDAKTDPVSIGGNPKYNQHFKGFIDEVRVWRRALSQSEIQRAMKGEMQSNEAGLAAWWSFDTEERKVVSDVSGNSQPARLENGAAVSNSKHAPTAATTPVTGAHPVASAGSEQSPKMTYLVVDGKKGMAKTGLMVDQAGPGRPVTFEAWVYPTAAPHGRHHVITTDNGSYDWSILVEGERWHVYTSRASKPTGFSVDLNRWQHVAAVFADDGVVFFKNGTPSEPLPIGYDANSDPVSIGGNVKYLQPFTGRIDEVRVWDGALSAQDIRANMEQQVAPGAAGLLGYWQFNADNGGLVEDASGKGNHARLGDGASIASGR